MTAATKQARKVTVNSSADRDMELKKHIPKMKEVHPERCELVNKLLKEKNIPLKVNAMHFTANMASVDSNCCVIDGMVVFGPRCGSASTLV